MNEQISRNKSQKQLRDPYRFLMEAVEGISDYAIFMLDSKGHIITWNEGCRCITGYEEEEVLNRHFSIFYTPEDLLRAHPEEELEIATKVGKFSEEGWRVRKNGTRYWTSVLITRLLSDTGELLGFSKVTRDLSEQRKVEDELRASEERFRLLVEGVKDYAIFLLDPNGIISSWNEGASRLKGYSAEEIIGQHFKKFYPQEDIDAGKCEFELEEAILTGRYEEEGWRLRKDGTRFWANVVITSVRDKTNRLLGFSKVTRDLTERRRAEEKLRRANIELERRVEERTEELTRAKEDLERAMTARDEFLSIASHELKTPITSLRLQAELLLAKFDPNSGAVPPAEKAVKSLEKIVHQSDRLTALIDYMLDISRAQLGKFTFEFVPTNVSEMVQDVVAQWRESLAAAKCDLSIEVENGVMARIDEYRMEQVLANLISNAIKYAPAMPVTVSLKKEGGEAVIRVTDHGMGIDPAKRERIFDRFERATAPAGVTGLGLGLFISKTIVEAHHGLIQVESLPRVGSTFTVRIPLDVGRLSEARA